MPLEFIIPQLPQTQVETLVYIIAGLGAILVIYSQFVEKENRRDLIRMIGAAGIFVYALYIFNLVFMVVSAGIFIAALVEFVEIMLGIHVHKTIDPKSGRPWEPPQQQ